MRPLLFFMDRVPWNSNTSTRQMIHGMHRERNRQRSQKDSSRPVTKMGRLHEKEETRPSCGPAPPTSYFPPSLFNGHPRFGNKPLNSRHSGYLRKDYFRG